MEHLLLMQEVIVPRDGIVEGLDFQQTCVLEVISQLTFRLNSPLLVNHAELVYSAPQLLQTTLFPANLDTNARIWPLLSLALLDTFKI